MDPLSGILSLMRVRSSVSVALDARANWRIDFPAHDGIKFNAVTRGQCWVSVGAEVPLRLETGDCFLLTQGRPFTLASDLEAPATRADDVYSSASDGVARFNGGGDFFLIGARFSFSGRHLVDVLRSMPPVIRVPREALEARRLEHSISELAAEIDTRSLGHSIVAEHLAQMMLVHTFRIYVDTLGTAETGWLGALSDKHLALAIGAIHNDPARKWEVAELAAIAGLSRSAFASRFVQILSISPIDYLTNWRMYVAADRLVLKEPVARVAQAVGYESASAFSSAFKRVMGAPPSVYRKVSAP